MKKNYCLAEIQVFGSLMDIINTSTYDSGNDTPIIPIED